MSWFSELIPELSHRRPLSLQAVTRDLLPAILCYYATALLVLIPRTFPVRLALLPITLWAALRAVTQLDFAAGYGYDEDLAYLNQGLSLAMTTLAMRVSIWTFQLQPYERKKSAQKPTTTGQLLLDALDLSFNLRGLGWSWSHGLRIPAETRDTNSRSSFLRSTLLSLVVHLVLFDFAHYSVQVFGPSTIGAPAGGTIYAASLPPLTRYARSTLITFLSGLTVYYAIAAVYLLGTLLSVSAFRQHPIQWPPIADRPWLSTSINQFWNTRWHQIFRDNFISFGGKPLFFLMGKFGFVVGAFLTSGILHYIGLWGMGRGTDFQSVGGYFLMMGVGVILEHSWKAATGSRVDGFGGWLWTMAWVIGWGNLLVEAWSTRGLVGSRFVPDSMRPSTLVFGSLFAS